MIIKTTFFLLVCISALNISVAQQSQTGKMVFKKKYSMTQVASSSVNFTISRKGNELSITGIASKNSVPIQCEKCTLSGRIVFTGGAKEYFKPVPEVAPKNTNKQVAPQAIDLLKGINAVTGKVVKSTIVKPDGSFTFTDMPKGTYNISLNDEIIATGWKIGGN